MNDDDHGLTDDNHSMSSNHGDKDNEETDLTTQGNHQSNFVENQTYIFGLGNEVENETLQFSTQQRIHTLFDAL
jgi:hypothetical protein